MKLWPFEISCIKNIIDGTESLLSFVDDWSCADPLLKEIQNWIDTIKVNKFNIPDKMQIDNFFDDCIKELENKKTLLRSELRLEILFTIRMKVYLKKLVLDTIREIKACLDSESHMRTYLNSLDRESLLLVLSLIYFGRDGVPVDVKNCENMSGEEYWKEKRRLIKLENKSQLIESKMKELDGLFEKDSFIVNQILGKFSKLKDYVNEAELIFID